MVQNFTFCPFSLEERKLTKMVMVENIQRPFLQNKWTYSAGTLQEAYRTFSHI